MRPRISKRGCVPTKEGRKIRNAKFSNAISMVFSSFLFPSLYVFPCLSLSFYVSSCLLISFLVSSCLSMPPHVFSCFFKSSQVSSFLLMYFHVSSCNFMSHVNRRQWRIILKQIEEKIPQNSLRNIRNECL